MKHESRQYHTEEQRRQDFPRDGDSLCIVSCSFERFKCIRLTQEGLPMVKYAEKALDLHHRRRDGLCT